VDAVPANITCSSGSTGGGIKMIRTLILAKQANRELTRLVHPAIVNRSRSAAAIPNNVVIAVLGFIFLYFMSVVMLTFVLILRARLHERPGRRRGQHHQRRPRPRQGRSATNYAVLTDFQTWVCSFTMLLGRLEVLSLAVVFTRSSGESGEWVAGGGKWAAASNTPPLPPPKSG
jgi:trk system potassium uptake protein TrkH